MVCRICHEYAGEDEKLLKYSTRHYAHYSCWMKKHSINSFDEVHGIPLWKLRQWPYLQAKEMGLHISLELAVKREERREASL